MTKEQAIERFGPTVVSEAESYYEEFWSQLDEDERLEYLLRAKNHLKYAVHFDLEFGGCVMGVATDCDKYGYPSIKGCFVHLQLDPPERSVSGTSHQQIVPVSKETYTELQKLLEKQKPIQIGGAGRYPSIKAKLSLKCELRDHD